MILIIIVPINWAFPPVLAALLFTLDVGVVLFVAHVPAVPQDFSKVALHGIISGGHLNKTKFRNLAILNAMLPPVKFDLKPQRSTFSAEIKANYVASLGKLSLA